MQVLDLASGLMGVPEVHRLNQQLIQEIPADAFAQIHDYRGYLPLRHSIALKYARLSGHPYTADQVLITGGVTMGIHHTINTLVPEGKEVVVTTPQWDYFEQCIHHFNAPCHQVELRPEARYKLLPEDLDRALDRPNIGLFIFTHPGNPGGEVYSAEELAALVKVFERYPNVLILSDEIYDLHVYNGQPFIPLCAFDSIADRIITANGFSKNYGLAAWRVGYLIAHSNHIAKLQETHLLATNGTGLAGQMLAHQVMEHDRTYRKILMQKVRPALESMTEIFRNYPLVSVQPVEGSFYVWADFSLLAEIWKASFGENFDPAAFFAQHYKIQFKSGKSFGMPFHLRINVARSEVVLTEALCRLTEGLEALHDRVGLGEAVA